MLAGASLSCVNTSARAAAVVEHRRLVGGIDRADGDAVHAVGEQILDDPLLAGGGAVAETELTVMSARSASAFSVPFLAMVQKSDALFVTKASVWLDELLRPQPLTARAAAQASAAAVLKRIPSSS